MSNTAPNTLCAVECLPYDQTGIGFALPLLAFPDNPNVRAVQEIDEFTNLVSAFKRLDYLEIKPIALPKPVTVTLGGDIVYSFVTEDHVGHAGTLKTLEPILRSFVIRCPRHSGICLQVMELVGRAGERQAARLRMKSVLQSRAGDSAANAFYGGSTLRASLWEKLLAAAPNKEIARRILNSRAKIISRIGADGAIELDFSALDSEDYSGIDLEKIRESLFEEFSGVTVGTHPYSRSKLGSEQIRKLASEGMSAIEYASWHEERVAIILDYILRDRALGARLLVLYPRDRRSGTATAAITSLQKALRDRETLPTNLELVKIAYREFSHVMSTTRARLLYSFAKHLAKYPEINAFVKRKVEISNSQYVHRLSKDIFDFLRNKLDE
jgi:hypothetical protein